MLNEMNDLSYNQILDDIFTAYTENPNIPLYGDDYYETLENLHKYLSAEDYDDIEGRLGLATSSIAFRGFCAGFRHAIILLLGDTGKFPETGGVLNG